MNSRLYELASPKRSRVLPSAPWGDVGFAVVGAVAASVAAYFVVSGQKVLAAGVCAVPVVVWMMSQPAVLLVLLGASLPDIQSLTGGRGGFNLSVSDLFLVLSGGAILLQFARKGSALLVRALEPIRFSVVQYSALMLVLLPFHLSIGEIAKTAQRYELLLIPLVAGAFASLSGWHTRVLQAYVLGATVLALTWPLDNFGMQKNPVGQMIGNAVLLLAGIRQLRRLSPFLLVLIPGLFLTQSRGAVVATAIGLIAVLTMRRFNIRFIARRVLPFVLIAVGAFVLMPASLQTRLTSFSASTNTPAQYAVLIRHQYWNDAERIIADHPWAGIGIGNYRAGNTADGTQTTDPHDVLLLQAAEGGYVLAAGFILLIVGCAFALRRCRLVDVGPAAAGIMLATFAHGLVDVYWVRGTPVLSWLLVGMAFGSLARQAEPATV